MMLRRTDRFEDMSRQGYLRLTREEDGDIIVEVANNDETGRRLDIASVQFCTRAGGGGSPRTLAALRNLMIAMAEDNLNASSARRTGRCTDQEAIAAWPTVNVESLPHQEFNEFEWSRKTDQEIVNAANELAREIYKAHGFDVPEGYRFDQATNPQEASMWNIVSMAFEALTVTDLEDALANIDE